MFATPSDMNYDSDYWEIETIKNRPYLSLKNRKNFSYAGGRNYIVGNGDEFGWTKTRWIHNGTGSGGLDSPVLSADENVSNATELTISHTDDVQAQMFQTTITAPLIHKEFKRDQDLVFVARIAGNNDENFEGVMLFVQSTTNEQVFARIGIHYNSGTFVQLRTNQGVSSSASGSTGTTPLTAQQVSDGIWVKIVIPFGYGGIYAFYNVSTDSEPPHSGWSELTTSGSAPSDSFWSGDFENIHAGLFLASGNTSTATSFVARYKYFWHNVDPANPYTDSATWKSTQYQNDSNSVRLWSGNPNSSTVDIDSLKSCLQSLENNFVGNNAVFTYSLVRGSSQNPSQGTFTDVSSLTASGVGSYAALYMKCLVVADGVGKFGPVGFPVAYI